jgi:divalent metal cation (Fe/Co/Zn/Cd) transporter
LLSGFNANYSSRKYYERCNSLIQQYAYIDQLLDSSLPHNLIQEYGNPDENEPDPIDIPRTISEEQMSATDSPVDRTSGTDSANGAAPPAKKVKRGKNLYRLPEETTPLLTPQEEDPETTNQNAMPQWTPEEDTDSGASIVKVAIIINLAANTLLLILKFIVAALTSSVSVLASLVDAILDFLSTAIVGLTTHLISRQDQDQYQYPIGRTRLEPIGILVFSVVMITSFIQVALEGFKRLTGPDHDIVQLSPAAVAIMASTVVVKGCCWLWCRLIKNSSVQALAQDAVTDVVFNLFSIIFPLVGFFARIWWLDSLGGILLSFYVIGSWGQTTAIHIRNLSGAAANADQRNVLLYLTMRFAKTIKKIQGLQAYVDREQNNRLHDSRLISVLSDTTSETESTLRST